VLECGQFNRANYRMRFYVKSEIFFQHSSSVERGRG
jgi:hypothetical protein